MTPTHWVAEEILTLKWVGSTETALIMNSTLGALSYSWEGTLDIQFFMKELRVWTTHIITQLLRLTPKEQAPKSPSSESQ